MSKTSKDPITSTLNINGSPKVQTTKYEDGTTTSNYNMSKWEERAYNYAQKEFANNLKNINVFSDDVLQSMQNEIDAYTNKGVKKIDDVYTPMIKNLENDIASRFGNLNNSIFLDKLSSIEDKRSDSISALAEDITAKESSLMEDELLQRYNYLNFLNNYQNQILNTALGITNSSTNSIQKISSDNGYSNLSSQLQDVTLKTISNLLNF